MKYEVEVKAKIDNLEEIITILMERGCVLSEPIVQDDYIYNLQGIDASSGHSHQKPVLRVRKSGGKTLFTLKINRLNELDCIEKELEISDGDKMQEVFILLGYEKTVEVHKKRQKATIGGYEICVDQVDGLGFFIEVEKMTEEEDGEKVQNEILEFMQSLGIPKDQRVMNGYDTLMLKKLSGQIL